MDDKKSFEATYVAYPFSVLVDFGLALSRLYVRARHRREETRKEARTANSKAAHLTA